MRSAYACSTATARASNRPNTGVRFSNAGRPCSMTCARGSTRSSFPPSLEPGKCGSEAAPISPKSLFLPSSNGSRGVIRELCFIHLVAAEETERLRRELTERKVDLLIARRATRFRDEVFGFELLYDSSFVVVAGARNPWGRKRHIALAELMKESWVLPPPESVNGPAYLEVVPASCLDYPRTSVFTASVGARLNLVATGRLLTMLPIPILRLSKRPGIKVLPVELQYAPVPVGIITLKKRTLSPVAQLFIETAREI